MTTNPSATALTEYLGKTLTNRFNREYAYHMTLASKFNPATGESVVSEEELTINMGCTSRTVRRAKSVVAESGLWTITPGSRKKSTSYRPTFLDEVPDAKA